MNVDPSFDAPVIRLDAYLMETEETVDPRVILVRIEVSLIRYGKKYI